jgi:hypothetical protein
MTTYYPYNEHVCWHSTLRNIGVANEHNGVHFGHSPYGTLGSLMNIMGFTSGTHRWDIGVLGVANEHNGVHVGHSPVGHWGPRGR